MVNYDICARVPAMCMCLYCVRVHVYPKKGYRSLGGEVIMAILFPYMAVCSVNSAAELVLFIVTQYAYTSRES